MPAHVSRALRAVADKYAKHKVVISAGHAIGDESPLAEGFADGYMRALENHGMTEAQLAAMAADMVLLSSSLIIISATLSEEQHQNISAEQQMQLQELITMSERYRALTQRHLAELARITDLPYRRRGKTSQEPPQESEKQRA